MKYTFKSRLHHLLTENLYLFKIRLIITFMESYLVRMYIVQI